MRLYTADPAAHGGTEEAYTVTLLSDAEAGLFGEIVQETIILNLAGFHLAAKSMFNPSAITVMSARNLTLQGGGEISSNSTAGAIDNRGILTVMDTVTLSSSQLYGLKNQKIVNLYVGIFTGYTGTSNATINLISDGGTYKTVYTDYSDALTIPNGACNVKYSFKVIPDATSVPEPPVAQIGDETYGSLLTSGDGGPYTVSHSETMGTALVSVHGALTVKNLVLDGGAADGLSAKAALVTLTRISDDPLPCLTLGPGAVVRNNRNQTSQGGGVYIWGGTLTLDGGKICGNSITGDYKGGGGVLDPRAHATRGEVAAMLQRFVELDRT